MRQVLTNGFRTIFEGRGGLAATLQTLIFKVLILITNMGTGIITARFLGPAGRGELAAMILWPQLLVFTIALGIPKSLLYNLKKYPEERSKFFSIALVLGTVLGILAAIIGIIFIPSWLSQYSLSAIRQAQWLMLTAPIALLGSIYLSVFEAEDDFRTANWMRYYVPLATLIVLLGLAITQSLTSFSAALAYVLPTVPINLWILSSLWKRIRPTWRNLTQPFKQLTSYGLRSYSIELISGLSLQIAQALTVGMLSSTAMGLYTVALSLSRMLIVFEDAIVTVLLPKTTARSKEEIVAITGRSVRVSLFISLLFVAILMLLGPIVLTSLYGQEFAASVPAFRILLIEITLSGICWILAQSFMANGQPGVVTILQTVGLGFTVPLMLLLVPTYQLVGASLALLGSTAARLIFSLISYPLFLKVHPPNLFITFEDFAYLKQASPFRR